MPVGVSVDSQQSATNIEKTSATVPHADLYRLTAVCPSVGARVCVCPSGAASQGAALSQP